MDIMNREKVLKALTASVHSKDVTEEDKYVLKQLRLSVAYSETMMFTRPGFNSCGEIPLPPEPTQWVPVRVACTEQPLPVARMEIQTDRKKHEPITVKTEYLSRVYGCPKVLEIEVEE